MPAVSLVLASDDVGVGSELELEKSTIPTYKFWQDVIMWLEKIVTTEKYNYKFRYFTRCYFLAWYIIVKECNAGVPIIDFCSWSCVHLQVQFLACAKLFQPSKAISTQD